MYSDLQEWYDVILLTTNSKSKKLDLSLQVLTCIFVFRKLCLKHILHYQYVFLWETEVQNHYHIFFSDCAKWSFNVGGLSHNLGAVVLKAYPYEESGYRLSVFNVSLTDIRWTCKNTSLIQYINVISYILHRVDTCVFKGSNEFDDSFTMVFINSSNGN